MPAENTPLCNCEVIHDETVSAVRSEMFPHESYVELAALMKMFGDPTRVRLLHALAQQEICVCDLAAVLGATKSAVSHQLKSLRLARLVKSRREGQIVYYSLADDHVKKIMDMGFEHIAE